MLSSSCTTTVLGRCPAERQQSYHTTTMPSTQYLQVPKLLPHRKSRSRSKSRPREVISVEDNVLPPVHDRRRHHSPPMTAAEPRSKPLLNAYSHTYSLTNGHSNNPTPKTVSISNSTPQPKTPIIETTNYEDLNGDMYTLRDCSTPPPELPLRQKIVGAWKLESYIAYPTPESPIQRPTYPMTKNVTGFIMYTPDGYLSAQMLIPGQQSFKRGEGEEPQWAEAGKRFFAYCGPYYISDEGAGREEILRHTFQVCNLPGWIGDVQVRTHRFEEDGQVLVLGSEEPTEIKGDRRIPVLKWRRARDNTTGTPPAPMPQIKISGPGEP
ncbi:hypothetical protein Q7P35_008458 [Cladosporium inversicolor]